MTRARPAPLVAMNRMILFTVGWRNQETETFTPGAYRSHVNFVRPSIIVIDTWTPSNSRAAYSVQYTKPARSYPS